MAAPANQRLFHPDASIVLVGCRGAGKRTLGFIGALHLRRRLVTEDHYFEQATGHSRAYYLRKHGQDVFVRKSNEAFKRMLDANRHRCIIECGIGSLSDDAQKALREFCRTNPVVYIHREREQMLRLLDPADAERLLEADQSHRSCSNLEYFNLFDSSNGRSGSSPVEPPNQPDAQSPLLPSKLLQAQEDFKRFLDFIAGHGFGKLWLESPFSLKAIPPEYRQYSYALRLRLSYLLDMDLKWEDLEAHGDCVELVIDHWPDDLLNVVARQVALIRRKLAVPIIYHVEENPRGERRRSQGERDEMDAELLELGLRLGVDYLSVDLSRKEELVSRFLEHRGKSRIVGNFWCVRLGATPWSDDGRLESYRRAQSLGCDVVRMVRFCAGDSPPELLTAFTERVRQAFPDPRPPLVAYDFSVLGTVVPLQSRVLSPIKHPDMETRREHLATVSTAQNAFEELFRQGLLDPLEFCTLGANVSYSLSPAMHHAAYDFSGMPHRFSAVPCATLEDLNAVCSRPSFGGASLTAPFKVAIMPHLKIRSAHAAAVGAVNVLLPLRGRSSFILDHATSRGRAGPAREFYGDNTDWSSILTCLRRAISPRNYVRPSRTTALVVGAGGMARAAIYALVQLGCRNIFVYSRTLAHAREVAQHFNDWSAGEGVAAGAKGGAGGGGDICHVLPSLAQPWPERFEPPTMVISCVPAVAADGSPAADFEMPRQWLGSPTGGVVVELAYEPLVTPLVEQMQAYRGDGASPSWAVVDGLEVVSEMAGEAFELMTGRPAPKRLMREVCRREREQQRRSRLHMS